MAEPNQGCGMGILGSILMLLGLIFFGTNGIPAPNTLQPISIRAMLTAPSVEAGLIELVDLSGLAFSEGQALVGTQIATSGLPNANARTFETIIDNDDIASAEAQISSSGGGWQILVTFTSEGSARFGDYTAANIGSLLGIVLDGRVLSAPTIQTRIAAQAVISGNFTESEARALAAQLNQ
ncbi:MAG: hypothetical protein SGI73_08115 [Chloroflexota bacterium]|nr:hypothetical protein [Chloroflexota bacterium]